MLAGKKAIYAGDPTLKDQVRKFAAFVPNVSQYLNCTKDFVNLVENKYHVNKSELSPSFDYNLDIATFQQSAQQAIIQFKAAGVTTVICSADPFSLGLLTKAAAAQNYHPEWFMTGSALTDQDQVAQGLYDLPEIQGHMFGLSESAPSTALTGPQSLAGQLYQKLTGHAIPKGTDGNYGDLVEIFDDLQAAGPDLTPSNMARGIHALPTLGAPAYQYGQWTYNVGPTGTPGGRRPHGGRRRPLRLLGRDQDVAAQRRDRDLRGRPWRQALLAGPVADHPAPALRGGLDRWHGACVRTHEWGVGVTDRMTDSKTDERGALFVTADSEDPRFNQPYIDVREWRDEPADAPVFPGGITTQQGGAAPFKARHLYVHGGFTGTDAKFSFCFPPEEEYQGRFFQATHQLLAGEEATPRNVAFALASGGYSVQTNMGGRDNPRTAEGSASGQVRHDDSGLPGQRRGREVLPRGGGRDLRPAPHLRLSLRRERRRLPNGHQCGDDDRRVGRVRPLRHGLAAIHPQLLHRARATPSEC